MSQDKHTASEEFLNQSLARAKKTYNTWVKVTISILVLEIAYFGILNYFYADYISFVPDIVNMAADKVELDENLKKVRGYPNSAAYSNNLQFVDKVLNDVIQAREQYSNELRIVETTLDKINENPDAAGVAGLATEYLVNELDLYGHYVATFTRDYVAGHLNEVPKMTRKEIPKYGARLRFDVNNWVDNFCTATSDGFGETFDAFLNDHADKIKEFSEAADDTKTLDELETEFTDAMANFLSTTSIEKYGTLQEQSDKFLHRLQAANRLLEPLVQKKTEELTAEELRLRRAVGLFMHLVYNPPAAPELKLPLEN